MTVENLPYIEIMKKYIYLQNVNNFRSGTLNTKAQEII